MKTSAGWSLLKFVKIKRTTFAKISNYKFCSFVSQTKIVCFRCLLNFFCNPILFEYFGNIVFYLRLIFFMKLDHICRWLLHGLQLRSEIHLASRLPSHPSLIHISLNFFGTQQIVLRNIVQNNTHHFGDAVERNSAQITSNNSTPF